MKLAASSFLIAGLTVLPLLDVTAGTKELRVTGTFSSLEFNSEGGDLLGAEIRIVLAQKGYQGALQIAEGEPSQLMVMEVNFDKDKVKFEIPGVYPVYGGGVFEGKVDAKGIKGVIKFKSGGQDEWNLKRGRSYWDK